VGRCIVELREDIRFEDDTWVPTDERTAALVQALCATCSAPRRLFSRPAAALDVEHVAIAAAARRAGEHPRLPDLNLFYVVDGDVAELAASPLVAAVVEVAPLAGPLPVAGAPAGPPAGAPADGGLLADAIDAAAAALSAGESLIVPYRVTDPASRAAAEIAARRGIHVFTPDGEVAGGRPAPARRARLRATVTLDETILVAGGDRSGSSELYVEGWVDDGVRRRFRFPDKGAVRGVQRGVPQPLDTRIYDGVPLGEALIVHVELWEEDLGRDSLVDPDDLLGVHERRFTQVERWGEGRHEAKVETDDGAGILRYTIRVSPP
jgi:hypothetical protein